MNGILWVMRTGAAWADRPRRYPPGATGHRRFQAWGNADVFLRILDILADRCA